MTAAVRPRNRKPPPRLVVLATALDREPRTVTLPRALTIAEAIRAEGLTFRLPTIAIIVGRGEPRPVLRRAWETRKVKRGETLMFVPVPRGGEGGSILGLVAAIALSIVAPWAGGAIAGALFGGSAIASSLISAGIVLAGSFLINAFLGPQQTAAAGAEPVYTAAAASNRAMPLGTIPSAYGTMRFPPPLAALPYSEFEGNDQVLYQLHCPSLGVWAPKRWEIGKTLVWTAADGFTAAFDGVEIEIIHPGDPITLFPANVVVAETVSGQTLPDPSDVLGPFTVNAAGTSITRIAVDFVFPGGLYTRGSGGSVGNASRHVVAEARPIDALGAPTGGWSTLFDETVTRATATPQRFTRSAEIAAGRYEVRFKALDADTSASGPVNRVAWAGLRGYLTNWTVPPGVTLIATKIRANDQISQQASTEYFFTGDRHLPAYDADNAVWSAPIATRSIAWAATDILRNADYGAGLQDGQFDLDWLAAYDVVWSIRGDRFDAVFDRAQPIAQALDAVLRAGRAYHVRLGGRLGFVRDEPKLTRRHVFGPANTLRGSHSRRDVWFDDDAPDAARVKYLDSGVWTYREVLASISSIGATKPASRELFGIVDRDHAWREAIYEVAQNAYRRSFRQFQVEHEGRQLVRGDAVLYHDPMIEEAAVARLAGRAGDTFTIDRDFTPADGETYHLIITDKRGREWGPVAIDAFPDARTLQLNPTDRLVVEGQHGVLDDILPDERSEPARLSICAGDYRLFDGLLMAARPSGDRFWEVLIVNDDQRVHTADETEIVPAPYTPPALYQPAPEAPSIDVSGFYAVARRGTLHIELEAGWRPAPGAVRYVGEISYDAGAAATPGAAAWTPVHDGVGTRFNTTINPQPFTLRVAAIGVRQGLWAYRTVSDVPEPVLGEGVVGPTSLNPVLDALLQQLRTSSQASLAARLDALQAAIEEMANANSGAWAIVNREANALITSVGQRTEATEASVTTLASGQADLARAIAQYFVGLRASGPGGESEVLWRMVAASLPEGALAAIDEELRAGVGGEFARAAIRRAVYANAELGVHSRIQFFADQIDGIDGDGNVYPMFAALLGGEVSVPIVAGKIQIDLRKRRLAYGVNLNQPAEFVFPIGAYDGAIARVGVSLDGINTFTVDPQVFAILEQPTVPLVAGSYMDVEIRVKTVVPPVAWFRTLSVGPTSLTSVRRLSVYPPVNGVEIWDLDFHGPLVLAPGIEYALTPLGEYLQANAKGWGPGGSTGAVVNANVNWSMTQPGAGTDTTFDDMVAGKGGTSASLRTAGGGDAFGTGGAAGIATGGDINTNGNAGGNADNGGFSQEAYSGAGAAAPDGGAATPRYYASSQPGQKKNGDAGNDHAGGAGGSCLRRPYSGNADQLATGGGGSGAKFEADYGPGDREWLQGETKLFRVGDSGAPGTAEDNFVGNVAQGGKGAAGLGVIT